TCRIGVSTSMKPRARNQARNAAMTRSRASRNGRRSAYTFGSHQGEGAVKSSSSGVNGANQRARENTGEVGQDQYGAPQPAGARPLFARQGILPVKVIASSLRKGNILDIDGK